jgi:hypothetical protein
MYFHIVANHNKIAIFNLATKWWPKEWFKGKTFGNDPSPLGKLAMQ